MEYHTTGFMTTDFANPLLSLPAGALSYFVCSLPTQNLIERGAYRKARHSWAEAARSVLSMNQELTMEELLPWTTSLGTLSQGFKSSQVSSLQYIRGDTGSRTCWRCLFPKGRERKKRAVVPSICAKSRREGITSFTR